jgi:hypothetical protein
VLLCKNYELSSWRRISRVAVLKGLENAFSITPHGSSEDSLDKLVDHLWSVLPAANARRLLCLKKLIKANNSKKRVPIDDAREVALSIGTSCLWRFQETLYLAMSVHTNPSIAYAAFFF